MKRNKVYICISDIDNGDYGYRVKPIVGDKYRIVYWHNYNDNHRTLYEHISSGYKEVFNPDDFKLVNVNDILIGGELVD